jgi:stage V sporulation protein SpoVS
MHPITAAKAIVGMIHKHQQAEVQALGHSAVQQVEQAILRATAHLEGEGIDIIVTKTRYIKPGADGNNRYGFRFLIRECEKR